MNAQTKKIEAAAPDKTLNVYARLNVARTQFHATELRKTGRNTFANYSYFELGDFLVPALQIFAEVGLCALVSFDAEYATMRIINLDNPDDMIVLTSPMGSAALKGCHEVQNIGAVETYQRRYLWVTALEIVEHDALDASTGGGEIKQKGAIGSSQPISDADWTLLVQLVEATGTDTVKLCAAYNADSLKDFTAEQFASAKDILEKRLAAKAKEPANA